MINFLPFGEDQFRREVAKQCEMSWTTLMQVCVLFNDTVTCTNEYGALVKCY